MNTTSTCKQKKIDFLEKPNELSHIKKVIGIVSGKGGVGKSLVTSILAILMNREGYKTAILDADITGPSIPKVFGIIKKTVKNNHGLLPIESRSGIQIMSLNLLLENESDVVIWRGPIITGVVKQFWTDVIWRDIDYMFIDMPPGTGDVPLTVFQSINVDGIIVVTSPQDLVSMIVGKAVNMAKNMNIPILGLVENMSYVICHNCEKKIKIFGESKLKENANKYNIELVGKIPLDSQISAACDLGEIEKLRSHWLDHFAPILKTI